MLGIPQKKNNKSNGKKAVIQVNLQKSQRALPPPPSPMRNSKKQGGQVAASSAYSTAQRSRAPKLMRGNKSYRIVHRELIQSVLGSTAFTVSKFPVNPGMALTFPWLSKEAQGWEQYRFNKCNFEYVTRTGTTTVGSVILAPDYDASDAPPATEAIVSTYQDAVEDATWRDQCCRLDPGSMHALGPRKFIRSQATPGDIKTFDVANFFLCTVEEADASAIGKLWVDYDVELFIPQISSGQASSPQVASQYVHAASDNTFSSGVAKPLLWDVSTIDPLGFGQATAGVFTPAAGSYDIQCTCSYNDSAIEQFTALQAFQKNGVAVSPVIQSEGRVQSAAANAVLNVTTRGLLSFNGTTDTFQVETTLTGVSGGITTVANTSQLIIRNA